MRWSEKSQSMIEYTVVILLVAASILLMRPYVIRAINAHMRGLEDTVIDSMRDNIKLTNAVGVPPLGCCHNPPCPPNPLEPCTGCADLGYCGDGYCCAATETPGDCPDCTAPTVCDGDGVCEPPEDYLNCHDCPPPSVCDGDGTCDPGETIFNCPTDCCPLECGINGCEITHCNEPVNCPADCCALSCPNQVCERQCGEYPDNCPDCQCDMFSCPAVFGRCPVGRGCRCRTINPGPPPISVCEPDGSGPCAGVVCDNYDWTSGCDAQCAPQCCTACFSAGGQYAGCTTWAGQCNIVGNCR